MGHDAADDCTCVYAEFVFGIKHLYSDDCPVHPVEADDDAADHYRDLIIDEQNGVR